MNATDIHKEFKKVVKGKIKQLETDIPKLRKSLASLSSLLGLYKKSISVSKLSYNMLLHIANREKGYKDEVDYIKSYGISTSLGDKILLEEKYRIVAIVNALLNRVESLETKEKELELYKKFDISYSLFNHIRKSFNFAISKALLRGYNYNIGMRMGSIFIKEQDRKFRKEGKELRVVDRGQSWKNLIYIAETHNDKSKKLLKDYRDNKIKQAEFRERMKEFTYPNTDKKWISFFVDDTAVWLKWFKAKCICTNKTIYKLTPSNYINTSTRLVSDAIKDEKTIENVIESKDYGLLKKMAIIKKMKSDYFKDFNKYVYDLQAS